MDTQSPRIGYGLTVQQSHADVLDPSYPYITNIVETVVLDNNDMVLARVDPPFEFSPTVQPLKISNCSGPSNPAIGTTLGIFGLGILENSSYPETMQVKCVETIADTGVCAGAEPFITQHICIPPGPCNNDVGGPMVAEEGGELYLVGAIKIADLLGVCSELLINITFQFISFIFRC